MNITPDQCKTARALLGWSVMMLAFKSRVSETTIRNFERGMIRPTPFKVFISEWRPASNRNGGRDQIGIPQGSNRSRGTKGCRVGLCGTYLKPN